MAIGVASLFATLVIALMLLRVVGYWAPDWVEEKVAAFITWTEDFAMWCDSDLTRCYSCDKVMSHSANAPFFPECRNCYLEH